MSHWKKNLTKKPSKWTKKNSNYLEKALEDSTLGLPLHPALQHQLSWEVEVQACGQHCRLQEQPPLSGPLQLSEGSGTCSRAGELPLWPPTLPVPACAAPPEPSSSTAIDPDHLRPWLESGNFKIFSTSRTSLLQRSLSIILHGACKLQIRNARVFKCRLTSNLSGNSPFPLGKE